MKYFCKFEKDKKCKYGGNKYYNYGFFQGNAGYCYKFKKWLHDLEKCPMGLTKETVCH